jgi:protein-serine/threonine kinase
MFEILTGRTPFEGEGEEETFTTADGLQIYWERTSKGQWVGSWNITSGSSGPFISFTEMD